MGAHRLGELGVCLGASHYCYWLYWCYSIMVKMLAVTMAVIAITDCPNYAKATPGPSPVAPRNPGLCPGPLGGDGSAVVSRVAGEACDRDFRHSDREPTKLMTAYDPP